MVASGMVGDRHGDKKLDPQDGSTLSGRVVPLVFCTLEEQITLGTRA
jgi:hypothetical protein